VLGMARQCKMKENGPLRLAFQQGRGKKKKKSPPREQWLARLDEGTGDGSSVQDERKWSPPSCVSMREGSGGEGCWRCIVRCHGPWRWHCSLALSIGIGVGVICWCWCCPLVLALVLSVVVGVASSIGAGAGIVYWCQRCPLALASPMLMALSLSPSPPAIHLTSRGS
jgi:hypothetical protein